MSERKWNVREYQPEDVHQVRDLYAKVFQQTRPLEHFIWRFHNNPTGRGVVMVAEDSDRIVGQYALMPTRLRLGSELVLGAQSLDTMTHPDYRNQGMFVALAKACMQLAISKGIEVLYGFPNQISYHGFVYRLNWDHTGDIPTWVRTLNPGAIGSISRPIRYLAALGLPLWSMGNGAPHGIDIRTERPSLEELVALADLQTPDESRGGCRIDRSIEWFKWRFDSESQRRYVWFPAYRDGNLKAWASFGLNDWGEPPLIDMSGSEADALEAVVSRATRHAKQLGLPQLRAVTNDKKAIRALKSCGYLQRVSLPLIVRSLTSRNMAENIHLHSSWRITSEDLDTF